MILRQADKVCPFVERNIVLAIIALVLAILDTTDAAEKVRFYPCGEDDDGDLGEEVLETMDIQSSPDVNADGAFVFDSVGEFVLLVASGGPVYVEGREGPDSLAIEFDGEDDVLTSGAFDPRDFSTFASLSQAWVKPSSDKDSEQQYVWSLGNDNGGVGISPDGHWELVAVSSVPDTVSDVPVAFDEWTHVAAFRGGNLVQLFVNGQLTVSLTNTWNGVGGVTVGNRTSGDTAFTFFAGAIDDFNIAGFPDFDFTESEDIDFEPPIELSDVPGDVDKDGEVNAVDYGIWSQNVGFDNGLGAGDLSTLVLGDLDQNGRIDFFDFQIIFDESNLEPDEECEPRDGVVVADDFLYNQPTKEFGPGGGFSLQDYGGGQAHAGSWGGRWVSVGNGIITGPEFEPVEQQFLALTTPGLSANYLQRVLSFDCVADEQTIYFGARVMTLEEQTPVARFFLSSPDNDEFAVSVGFDPLLGIDVQLGFAVEFPFDPIVSTPGEFHQLVGKLEINASGSDERLTVWLDPDDVESGEYEIEVEGDVVTRAVELSGVLRLNRGTDGAGPVFWDDVAVGTTWESVTTVDIPRIGVAVDAQTGDVSLVNFSRTDIDVNFYQLSSESGSLNVDGWSSLADQPGDLWQENSPSAHLVTESSYSSEVTTIAAGSSLSLGKPVTPGAVNDVIARVGTRQGLFNFAPATEGGPTFLRGDANGDCTVNVADAVAILNNLFGGGEEPACLDAADVDDDGAVVITDPVNLLNFLFSGGPAPAAPGPDNPGPDPTEDMLGVCVAPTCGG